MTTTKYVFIADDDRDLRAALAYAVRSAGYEVATAPDGHALLALLSAASRRQIPTPDAIVIDIRMPRMSGLDLLRAIRLAEWQQPVVVMTGFGDAALHAQAAALGATVILDKPFEEDDLIGVLDILTARWPSDLGMQHATAHAGIRDTG